MSVSVIYCQISNNKDRHANHCDLAGTYLTKENPMCSFVKVRVPFVVFSQTKRLSCKEIIYEILLSYSA